MNDICDSTMLIGGLAWQAYLSNNGEGIDSKNIETLLMNWIECKRLKQNIHHSINKKEKFRLGSRVLPSYTMW